ncbi:MAG: GNAT family N-acetyltransferase [Thermoguttaceae bacterium]|nr:GNAT family N-acetyltransferase [Thermoguttaceae bacterium]MDW8037046.1 GNAT family N-acetyltransferase [Thermoguttaceae bacterium]
MATSLQQFRQWEPLAGFRDRWNELLAHTPGAQFFQSWDWLAAYWKHFHAGQQLRVFFHWEGQNLVGIVPLVVREEKTRVGRIRVLTYPLDDWGSFYGPIGLEPTKTLLSVLQELQNCPRDWDLLELRWISPDDEAAGWTRQAFEAAGFCPIHTLWNQTAVVDVVGGQAGWQRYLGSRSAKWRANLRRAEKKLAALGPVEYLRYRPLGHWAGQSDPRWDLYETCYQISQRSWQAGSQTGTTLCHPEVQEFLRQVHKAAAELGAVDINILYVRGQPAAFLYNYYWHGYVYGLRRGFDPWIASQGAGNVLLAWAIRDSFLRNDVLYDLGVGYLETKQPWMTRLVPIHRYSYIPSGRLRMVFIRWKRRWQARRARCR